MADLVVAGAGMAGLVAAAEAAGRGASVTVFEKGDRAGGAMLLSSGVIWRHRDFARFRRDCPGGDPTLQKLVHTNLDRDLAWLESLGGHVVERDTGNRLTVGARFSTRSLTEALSRRVTDLRLSEPLMRLPSEVPVVLAMGGFAASPELVRAHITPEADHLLQRTTRWSTGDGLRTGLDAGATLTSGMDELYGRNMPVTPSPPAATAFVRLAQLYARHAVVESTTGERFATSTWSEIDVVQWTARQPGAQARYTIDAAKLDTIVGRTTIRAMVDAAQHAGGSVRRDRGRVTVEVVAGITTTLGGLAVDERARAAEGVYAAGGDVGGIATGGYSSGLAAALVLGRIAARSALADT